MCGVDAVHRATELDVHQDQVRSQGLCESNGLVAAAGMPYRLVPLARQLVTDIQSNNGFIFNHENTGFGHGRVKEVSTIFMVRDQSRRVPPSQPSGEHLKPPGEKP
jgi:hypothetical protein